MAGRAASIGPELFSWAFGSYQPRRLMARDLGHHRQGWLVPRATMSDVESRLVCRRAGPGLQRRKSTKAVQPDQRTSIGCGALVSLNAGITSFANRSSCSKATFSGTPTERLT